MIISLGRKSSNQTKNAKKIRRICVIGQILIIIYVTVRTSKYGLDKTISQMLTIDKNLVSRFAVL